MSLCFSEVVFHLIHSLFTVILHNSWSSRQSTKCLRDSFKKTLRKGYNNVQTFNPRGGSRIFEGGGNQKVAQSDSGVYGAFHAFSGGTHGYYLIISKTVQENFFPSGKHHQMRKHILTRHNQVQYYPNKFFV